MLGLLVRQTFPKALAAFVMLCSAVNFELPEASIAKPQLFAPKYSGVFSLPQNHVVQLLVSQSPVHERMPRRRRPARPGALADLAPLRILTQIAVLQLLYYLVAGALILFTTLVAGGQLSPALLFDWQQIRGDVTTGWTLALCWMMTSLVW